MAHRIVRPRQVLDRGQQRAARIPRQPGLDVTLRPGESWPRHAIAEKGERLELTPYIKNLIRQGDLELVPDAEPEATPEPAPELEAANEPTED